jgi:hypothetical protein
LEINAVPKIVLSTKAGRLSTANYIADLRQKTIRNENFLADFLLPRVD